ncbi:MAG TPA: FAD-binding protein [Kineosporiaceae bacterium]
MASEAWPGPTSRASRPVRVERPHDVEGVVDAVRAAVREGLPVRPMGAGSTATGLTLTDGVVLDLTGLDRVRSVDTANGRAVVEAGIRLSRLWPLLWEHGLAVDGPGGQDRQTLGGAIATGEHGSGLRFGGLASRVQALEMVLADGSVVRCSPERHADLFQAARVGLGAFGVVTAVTLVCDPAQDVELAVLHLPGDGFLDQADDLVERFDHVEFGWRPDTDEVLCTAAGRASEIAPVGPPVRATSNRQARRLSADGAATARARGLARVTGLAGRASGFATGWPGVRMLADRGYRVFGRRVRPAGRESEFAVPRACFPAVFEELRERLEARDAPTGSVRVRFGAAEDAWLAMGQGRETAYLCASAPAVPAFEPFFGVLELVAARYDGRPHWGRPHRLRADVLRARYPRFDDARVVRDRVDPRRVFSNLHLQRVLGT